VSENNPIRVFVTHGFTESADYLRLFEFLECVDRFYYVNVSKPENIPTTGGMDAIKEELIAQIKAAEVLVVVTDVFTEKADLVEFMMDVAHVNKIGMVSVKSFGGMAELPASVVDRTGERVEWNAREIVDAIKRQGRGEDTARWEVIDFPGFDADGEIEKS
jgi:hypothetical protein